MYTYLVELQIPIMCKLTRVLVSVSKKKPKVHVAYPQVKGSNYLTLGSKVFTQSFFLIFLCVCKREKLQRYKPEQVNHFELQLFQDF